MEVVLSVGSSEQDEIQAMIEAQSVDERLEMRQVVEKQLEYLIGPFGDHVMTETERSSGEVSIEILTRLDATEQSKGAFFRARRRVHYVHKYFKP